VEIFHRLVKMVFVPDIPVLVIAHPDFGEILPSPTSVMQTVTRASYSDSPDEDFNFRTNFAPAINPSHFFAEPFDVNAVFEHDRLINEEAIEESLGDSQSLDGNSFNYEFLTETGVPSA